MAVDYSTPARKPRTLAEPRRHAEMTPAQKRANEATKAILRRYCDEAEAHLRERAARAQESAGGERLCPCGIAERDCQCPLRQGRAHAAADRG